MIAVRLPAKFEALADNALVTLTKNADPNARPLAHVGPECRAIGDRRTVEVAALNARVWTDMCPCWTRRDIR